MILKALSPICVNKIENHQSEVSNRNYTKLRNSHNQFWESKITICVLYTKNGGKTYHAQVPHGSTFKNLRRL